ncbi:MAG: 4Fe-4S dicluster domain-containing protein [Nitrospiraceae bacterium]|nr:MAG: 4Fe-4S dicluster domain-containing protein [Nitrospiraceae bacterium]
MIEQKELKTEDIKKSAEEKSCAVEKALSYVTGFLSGPMCGRCFPCALGTYEMKARLQNIADGRGRDEDLAAIGRIAGNMLEASMCKKGKDTAKFVLEWIGSDVFKKHIEGVCPDKTCVAMIEYRIVPGKCNMCGLCKDACIYGAIHGEKKKPYLSGYLPYEIRQKKCQKCGDCIKVCPTGAIILVDAKERETVGV